MNRRSLSSLVALLWLLGPHAARAQRTLRLSRIARISTEIPLAQSIGPAPIHPYSRALVHGLRELG